MKLSISSEILDQIQTLARHGAPLEICGLLFGENGAVQGMQPANNVAKNASRHFEIDPAILISAERAARDNGPPVLGYYHSHPSGDIQPSKTDADNAAPDGQIWLITNGIDVSVWQAVQDGQIFGRFDPIALECDSG